MPVFETLALITLAGLAWFWLDSLRARDIAIAAARAGCVSAERQFLDESVSNKNFRLIRDEDGRVRIGRTYLFEYSENSNDRRRGSIVMIGKEVIIVNTGLTRVH